MTASPRPTGPAGRSAGRTIGRIVWMTVKLLTIPVLCVIALIFGLAVGYTVLGGKPLSEVFDINTWKHMYDLVFAEG
jgi:hypothetical protein